MLALSGKGRALIKAGEIDDGPRAARRGERVGDVRRHQRPLGRPRLLHDDQHVPGPRRLPPRGRVDRGGQPLVRHARRHGLPRRMPHPPRRGAAPARRLAGGGGAGARGVRGAPGLRPQHHGERALRDRRDPTAQRRLRGSRGVVPHLERARTRPQPGLSLLRLAEGKVDAAVAGISALAAGRAGPALPAAPPSRPGRDRDRRRRPQDGARAARGRGRADRGLRTRSANRRAAAFDATVHFARGQILLAEKDWDGAIAALQHARDEWQGVGAPYETARARLLLGTAYRAGRRARRRRSSSKAALATFERLGAGPEAARVKELLGRVETRRTFLFTDIVDSTRLLDTLGDEKWKRLLARHDELVREAIAEAGGEVVKQTGDGFFASFENPKAAVDAAVAIQRALAEEIVAPDVRIGAHAGGAFRTGADVERLRRAGRARRRAHRRGGRRRRDPRQRRDARGCRRRRSGSPSRETESLKGIAQPVEVVSVDWR